jgi:hypothetical protein
MYNKLQIILPIGIGQIIAFGVLLYEPITKGEFTMDAGLWGIAIALISVAGTVVALIFGVKKDTKAINNVDAAVGRASSAVGNVKSDTADTKPRVEHIEKNVDSIKRDVDRNLNTLLSSAKSVEEIKKETDFMRQLRAEASPVSRDHFIASIDKLIEENAFYKSEYVKKEMENRNYKAENQTLKEKLEKFKPQQQSHDRGLTL